MMEMWRCRCGERFPNPKDPTAKKHLETPNHALERIS